MRRLAFFLCALTLTGCWLHDHDDHGGDGGPLEPPYERLDDSTAALSITVAPDDQTANVQIALTGDDGQPVVLQAGQEISVNQAPLPEADGGAYGKTIPGAGTYAVTVDEPEHGVATTPYLPPRAFTISSTTFDLAGAQLSWGPVDSSARVEISLSQQTPDGPQSATFELPSDTGSRTFTDVELKKFVQGFPLTIEVTKSEDGAPLEGVAQSQVTVSRMRVVSIVPTSSP